MFQVTFNPVDKEHLLTNSTLASSDQSRNIDSINSNYTNTSTSSSNRSDLFDKSIRISSYVDFSDYYKNVEAARQTGTLPTSINFS